MSDTTTTITPEERRMFAEDANDILANEKKNLERRAAAKGILRLLTSLEAAEARAEKAEANVARLTNERDWLASWGDAHPCCMDLQCPFGRTLEQCEAREGGMLDSTECWQEAARRAVGGVG